MRLIDEQFLETPWYGSRQMARHFRREGYTVDRKRVRRLMAKMGLAPIYQRPRTTVPHPGHRFTARHIGTAPLEPGLEGCCNAGRSDWSPWRWQTRSHASRGALMTRNEVYHAKELMAAVAA